KIWYMGGLTRSTCYAASKDGLPSRARECNSAGSWSRAGGGWLAARASSHRTSHSATWSSACMGVFSTSHSQTAAPGRPSVRQARVVEGGAAQGLLHLQAGLHPAQLHRPHRDAQQRGGLGL